MWDLPPQDQADLTKFPRFECVAGQKTGWVPYSETYQNLLRNALKVATDGGEPPTIKMTIEGWGYDLNVWDQPQQHIGSHQVSYQKDNTSGRERPIRIIKPEEAD